MFGKDTLTFSLNLTAFVVWHSTPNKEKPADQCLLNKAIKSLTGFTLHSIRLILFQTISVSRILSYY